MKEALKKEEILFLNGKYAKNKKTKEDSEASISRLIWNIKNNTIENKKVFTKDDFLKGICQ